MTVLESDLLTYLAHRARPVSAGELLREVWNYAPSVQSRAVAHTVRRLRKKLDDEADRLVSVYGEGYAVDIPDTGSLVGRREALAEIQRLLETHGVVTVYGLGGVGKTSLARRLAATLDALWIECRALTDEQDFLVGVARALGAVPTRMSRPAVGELLRTNTPDLLVLDGAESVGSPLFEWIHDLRLAYAIPVLVTSRQREDATTCVRLDPLPDADAARLFERCVRRAGAEVDRPDPVLVEELVSAVSGIPLALELAAARLRLLQLATLVRDVQRDVAALGRRDGSLEALLAKTWEGLDSTERALLAVVAWVARPLDIDTLVAVSGLERWTLLDALDALVDASLVVGESHRFGVLDVVARFVNPRTPDEVSAQVVSWAADRARELRFRAREDPDWAAEALTTEIPTLRRALECATTDVDRGWLALAVLAYEMMSGGPGQAVTIVAGVDIDRLPPTLAIEVMHARTLSMSHGTAAQVEQAKAALALALAEGSAVQRAVGWNRLVFTRRVVEGAEAAAEHLADMLQAATEDDVPWSIASNAAILGSDVAGRLDDLDHALRLVEQARTSTPTTSLLYPQVVAREAALNLRAGREGLGVELAERAYQSAVAIGLPLLVVTCGHQLLLNALDGDGETLIEAVVFELEASMRELAPWGLAVAAVARSTLEPVDQATTTLRDAAEQARGANQPQTVSLALRELGFRLHDRDGPSAAVPLYAAARDAVHEAPWRHERLVATVWHELAVVESTSVASSLDGLPETPGLGGVVLEVARTVLERRPPPARASAERTLRRTVALARRAIKACKS